MKESENSKVAPGAPLGARYRYFSTPPATVSLRLADIAPQIPESARLPAFDVEHSIELPCEDVFAGPAPKLLLSRLAEIAGERVRLDGVPDYSIRLPAARLALAYRFVNGRELIEEEIQPASGSADPEKSFQAPEDFAPKEESSGGDSVQSARDSLPESEVRAEEDERRPAVADPVAGSPAPDNHPPADPPLATAVSTPAEVPLEATESGVPLSPVPGASLAQESARPADEVSPPAASSKPPAHETWRAISIFPIFRRKTANPAVAPPDAEAGEPRTRFVPLELSSRTEQPAPAEATPLETEVGTERQRAEELVLAAPAREAVLVEIEPLPKSESKRAGEIPDQDALQAVFMTEEFLSVDRVVELCGGLPGITSCVLAHGSAVLASHNVPESIDLVSLSAHALEMLAAMRQSAARMGIGAVPAVTIHSEKGPITFFHQDDLCLLVLHKDRGFVPGVREKLQQVVARLSEASLVLPVGASRPALAPREATF